MCSAGDQPVPGEAAGRDEQLPAEDWHPRAQDHREGDGEELHEVIAVFYHHIITMILFSNLNRKNSFA